MITVNVLYFGAVREACKVAHEKISLESGTTVDGLVDQLQIDYLNRPGMSGDSSSWKGWGHVRWFIEEVPAGAA